MAEAADDAAEEGGATAAASSGAGVRLGTGDPAGPGLSAPGTARTPEARRLGGSEVGRIRGGERRRRPRAEGAGRRELTAIGGNEVGA